MLETNLAVDQKNWLLFCLTDSQTTPPPPKKRRPHTKRATAHTQSAWGGGGGVLDREGNMMFAVRALIVALVDGSISDQLQ